MRATGDRSTKGCEWVATSSSCGLEKPSRQRRHLHWVTRSLQACERKTERAALTESPVWTKAWRLEGACGLLPKLFPPCQGASLTFRNISDHLPDLLPLSQIRAQGPNPRLFQVSPTSSREDWERSQKGHTVALDLWPISTSVTSVSSSPGRERWSPEKDLAHSPGRVTSQACLSCGPGRGGEGGREQRRRSFPHCPLYTAGGN